MQSQVYLGPNIVSSQEEVSIALLWKAWSLFLYYFKVGKIEFKLDVNILRKEVKGYFC